MLLHGSSYAASRSTRVRVVLLASIAALVVTTYEVNAAPAARAPATTDKQVAAAEGDDFSSRRRARARRGNAAGLAMMGMMVGTIGAVIAAQQRRERYRHVYYDRPYGYGYGYGHPHVYRQPYAYYAPRAYHHPRVYRGPSPVHVPNALDRYQYIDPTNPNSANPIPGVPRIGF